MSYPFEKNTICYICGHKFTEAGIFGHRTLCLRKWQEEHAKLLQSELKPSHKTPSIFPLIQSKNQQERERALYDSAKIEVLSCSKCDPCIACRAMSTDKNKKITIQSQFKTLKTSEFEDSSRILELNTRKSQKEDLLKIICYVCGREFDTEKIDSHEPECLNEWHIENNRLPPEKQRPIPEKPDFESISYPDFSFIKMKAKTESLRIFLSQKTLENKSTLRRLNSSRIRENLKEIASDAQKAIMLPCQKCGKKILADRFSTHLNTCFEPKLIKPATSHADYRPSPSKGVTCYVCCRKYGISSIEAHEVKCLERWRIQNIGKQIQEPVKRSESAKKAEKDEKFEIMNNLCTPVDCERCRQKFKPETFIIHERNCFYFRKNTELTKPPTKNSARDESSSSPQTPHGSCTSRSASSKVEQETSHKEENDKTHEENDQVRNSDKWFCPNCVTDRVTICLSSNLYKNIYNLY